MSELTLMRESPCARCGYPMILEWASAGGRNGPQHARCKGPGDPTDMNVAFDYLSEDDQQHLLKLMKSPRMGGNLR